MHEKTMKAQTQALTPTRAPHQHPHHVQCRRKMQQAKHKKEYSVVMINNC
jgi:hypothetical protein